MGAVISAYWPQISDDQRDSQPGFHQDCKTWARWLAESESDPEVVRALRVHEVDSVRTHFTDGMQESDVSWVTPHALAADALWLRHLVLNRSPGTQRVLEVYARADPPGVESVELEMAQDLLDIAAIARFAIREKAPKMTLEVNW
jgi:hypothetical protein